VPRLQRRARHYSDYFSPKGNQKRSSAIPRLFIMKDEYDFSESVQNPYFKKLKKQVTIRLEEDVVDYFKGLSEEMGIPYQSLINLYLQDCVRSQKKLSLEWVQTT
jgi:uncharacterized protein (DUF4415 family)